MSMFGNTKINRPNYSGSYSPNKGSNFSVGGLGGDSGALGNWDVIGKSFDKANPWIKGKKAEGQYKDSLANQQRETAGAVDWMNSNDRRYLEQMQSATKGYGEKSQYAAQQYMNQLQSQGANAKETYTGTILPVLKEQMEGKGYENMAKGTQQQGLADAGVLNAMGAQSMASQMGGQPMTGGQMQAMMGANLAQGGAAYQRAAAQANRLREQGLESRYQGAQNYENAYGNYMNGQDRYNSEMLGTRQGLARDQFGQAAGMNTLDYSLGQGQQQRQIGLINQKYGAEQGLYAGQMANANAQQSGLMSSIGTVFGGMMGGAGGAKAGGQVGGTMGGQTATPQNQQQGQYQDPNSTGGYQRPQNGQYWNYA